MNTRNLLIAAAAAAALSALATGASAAGSVSATANASVTVITAATITKTSDLVFGTVVRPTAGTTTISMTDTGVVSASGGTGGSVVAGPTSAAKFTIASIADITYTTSQSLSFTQTGLLNVQLTPVSTTSGTPGQVAANGSQEIRYGASFDITPTTPAQAYTGALSVTVNYN